MTASQPGPQERPADGGAHPQGTAGRTKPLPWRPFLAGVSLILLIIFAVENTTRVKVHWVFFTSDNALISVIIVSAILGALVGQLAGRVRRSRRKHAQG
ncbi:MAG: hypothetical protein ACRD1G_15930 [Acidimicrobiales bacterium]